MHGIHICMCVQQQPTFPIATASVLHLLRRRPRRFANAAEAVHVAQRQEVPRGRVEPRDSVVRAQVQSEQALVLLVAALAFVVIVIVVVDDGGALQVVGGDGIIGAAFRFIVVASATCVGGITGRRF